MSKRNPKKKEWLQPEGVMNAIKVFKSIGKKALDNQRYETAINFYDIAEDVTELIEKKMPLCVLKSEAHRALGNIEEARYEAVKALIFNKNVGDDLPFLNMANQLFNENEFEESTAKYVKTVKNKNQQYKKGINLNMVTLRDCMGTELGDIFDDVGLGPAVQKMKQEELSIMPKRKSLSQNISLSRDLAVEKRKKYLSRKYLGKLANEKEFLMMLEGDKRIKIGSKAVTDTLQSIITTTLEKIDIKEKNLWHRKPLYTYFSKVKSFQTSEYAKQFEAHRKQLDKTMLEFNIIKQLKELQLLIGQKQYLFCFNKMMRLRDSMQRYNDKQLPRKQDLLDCMFDIVGEMYLETKKLIPRITQEINDLRIKRVLGVNVRYRPALIDEVFHVEVNNSKKLENFFRNELKKAQNIKEKAFLNHEVACLMSMNGATGPSIKEYCFQILNLAKQVKSVPWFLNSLFLIGRCALTSEKLEDAKLIFLAAREACKIYNKINQAEFVDRACLLLQHLKPDDFFVRKGIIDEEIELVKCMPTTMTKFKASRFISSLNEIPAWKRLVLSDTGTVKERIDEIKNLRPLPIEKMKEEDIQNIKHYWIAGIHDKQPYTVKDLLSEEEKAKMLKTVYTQSKYAQLLSLESFTTDENKTSI